MKTSTINESKVLLEVRRIKEELAREAAADPNYYQRLNGLGAKLLTPYRKTSKKQLVVDNRHRDSHGRIEGKRSDALNSYVSKPISSFPADATVAHMRPRTGKKSLSHPPTDRPN
jgi:hypothetical protein